MKNRKGVSLIELTINLSAASGLMLIAVSAVHSVMTLRSTATELTDHSRSMARLSLQLRRDVHSADAASMNSENELQLDLGNMETVRYRIVDGAIIRKSNTSNPSKLDESNYERFTLRASTLPELVLSKDFRSVELAVSRQTPSQAEPKLIENRIRAVVGLWKVKADKEQP